MSAGTSLWAGSAIGPLTDTNAVSFHTYKKDGYRFDVIEVDDSIWIRARFESEIICFRAAYSPGGFTDITLKSQSETRLVLELKTAPATCIAEIWWPETESTLLRYSLRLIPEYELLMPFWPRDILIVNEKDGEADGGKHISQTGTRSGLILASYHLPSLGFFLYVQNLTALAAYNTDTKTSANGTIGGEWPEMGFSLPPSGDKPLHAGKTYSINDAFVLLGQSKLDDHLAVSRCFLESLARIYVELPRPETAYQDYLSMLPKTLNNLQEDPRCRSHVNGNSFLNAYVDDKQTPPEIMVQLAVLLPIQEYTRWSGQATVLEGEIKSGLTAFYRDDLQTIMRWLPSEAHKLDGSEEHKKPLVMDSWYLHHPLLNLARMALNGDDLARDLVLKSVGYAIGVARHFNYQWPVFYRMDTLETIKTEGKAGDGGEKDVAGLYAHVMLQLWELTSDRMYFDEARKAADSILKRGLHVFYQANNSGFAAIAMIRLFKETGDPVYRDLSYLFLANEFKNVALWECRYGYGHYFPGFFALFPLNDAPYVAVYEEHEVFSCINEYLARVQDIEILPSVRLLLAEFIRYAVHRLAYYYPPMLPKEMLADKARTGTVDPGLWIPLEDIHDGWEKSGSVGQEVYGAGLAFSIVPRQYVRIPGQSFLFFTDYPTTAKSPGPDKFTARILGDKALTCRICLIATNGIPLPEIRVEAENEADPVPLEHPLTGGPEIREYLIHGDQQITVRWTTTN